mmetsp:Transcript_49676/g.153530  ORF Transcript_49676/g.153530 Transcript_49676/m.153530 type:complete len:115 (+) Transcript_49676:435-779(+)
MRPANSLTTEVGGAIAAAATVGLLGRTGATGMRVGMGGLQRGGPRDGPGTVANGTATSVTTMATARPETAPTALSSAGKQCPAATVVLALWHHCLWSRHNRAAHGAMALGWHLE